MKKMVLLVMGMVTAGWMAALGCTSALVGAERGAEGRWLLWKHRDSGHAGNYVVRFAATDSTLAYVALFNAADTAALEAWIGFNEAGFAVMNTASYNIPAPRKGWADREGMIMTEALRRCRTVGDFHRLIADYDGPLGVQANFGAFDAEGNGAYFETSDHQTVVFPMDSTGILTRTNYSLSGGPRKRLGLSRHEAEKHLIDSILPTARPWARPGQLVAEDLIETLSRSFYLPSKGIDLLDGEAPWWPDEGDVIPRRSSCASVVIEGPLPGEDPARTMVMWIALGFPPLSVVEAVTLDSVPPAVAIGNHGAALRDKAVISRRFNLPYLRRQVPLRRAESLQKYHPARQHRK